MTDFCQHSGGKQFRFRGILKASSTVCFTPKTDSLSLKLSTRVFVRDKKRQRIEFLRTCLLVIRTGSSFLQSSTSFEQQIDTLRRQYKGTKILLGKNFLKKLMYKLCTA